MKNLNTILNKNSNKLNLFIKQFLIILLYLILNIILAVIFHKDLLSNNELIMNISNILVYLILLVVFILLFKKTIIPDYYDFKKNIKKYIKDNYIYYIIGLIIMFISNIIISYFIGMPTNEEANRNMLLEMPIYSMLAMVIFAPIIEELMTRKILKDAFKNPYIYATLSGLIFGSLHLISATKLTEIFYIIPYGALGFAFAIIYSKTNNIWSSIFFHSIHNLIALILIFVGV